MKSGTEHGMQIEEREYKRTWDQDEEYGLLQPLPYEQNHLGKQEQLHQFVNLIQQAKKIVAFTGAGISVGTYSLIAMHQTFESNTKCCFQLFGSLQ